MKVEKGEFLIDGGKSAMMTMRRRPLADRSRLELRQPEKHGCQRSRYRGALSEALWKLAPQFVTARVLGRTASAVLPTHQRCGHMVADGSDSVCVK